MSRMRLYITWGIFADEPFQGSGYEDNDACAKARETRLEGEDHRIKTLKTRKNDNYKDSPVRIIFPPILRSKKNFQELYFSNFQNCLLQN